LYSPDEYWIEGIGSDYGTLGAGWRNIVGNKLAALCYWENDQLIYSFPLNMCTYVGPLCPHFLEGVVRDTVHPGEYYEYQLELTPCPSDSIRLRPNLLPTFLTLDHSTGIISGTIPIWFLPEYWFNIYVINWRFYTDYVSFKLTVTDPVNVASPAVGKQLACYTSNEGVLHVNFENKGNYLPDVSIDIFTATGNHVLNYHCSSASFPLQFNTATWPQGIYIAVVYSDGSARGKAKFVVR
jgi:hypothetical protein